MTAFKIVSGSDGNLWFSFSSLPLLGRMTLTGSFTQFPSSGSLKSNTGSLCSGPGGDIWFGEGTFVGDMTTAGVDLNDFQFNMGDPNSIAETVTVGPDGNIWVAEGLANKVTRVTPTGTVDRFTIPTASGAPFGLAVGPDSALWFTELLANKIGRITTTGVVTAEYALPAGAQPTLIVRGADGNMWFVEQGAAKIGRITIGGILLPEVPLTAGNQPQQLVLGPDGNIWFTANSEIGKITSAGVLTEYPLSSTAYATGITVGADNNIWITEGGMSNNRIARFLP
jgi:virginiamycin B lyase